MKIAIEAQRIFRTNKHGMDFVALETIRELQKTDQENEYFIFVSPGKDRCLKDSDNLHIVELSCPTYPLWEQIALPKAVKRLMPDLLHCTSNTAPLHCPVPLILTLHDIIYLEKRQSTSKSWYQEMGWYYRRMIVPRILPHCSKIITVSQFERQRIREALHLPDEQLVTVYNGYSPHFYPHSTVSDTIYKYIETDDYLFFLGNTDPKKNTSRVLKAYSLYLKQSATGDLTVNGGTEGLGEDCFPIDGSHTEESGNPHPEDGACAAAAQSHCASGDVAGTHLSGDGSGQCLEGTHTLVISLFTVEAEPSEQTGQAMTEPAHLNETHPHGEPDAGTEQEEQKDIVPEKVTDAFDQRGKLLHDR